MKITTFNPEIITSESESVVKLFEELGFEKKHNPVVDTVVNAEENAVSRIRMKDDNGFHVDIVEIKSVPQTITGIRINVDNFEEAYDLLTEHGFKLAPGVEVLTLPTAKIAFMVSPSGYIIDLFHHIKK